MADAPRPFTREQLRQFLRDHAAIRTMERMSQESLVDTPAAIDGMTTDLTALTAHVDALQIEVDGVESDLALVTADLADANTMASVRDARINEAVAAANRLSEAIEGLLLLAAAQPAPVPDEVTRPIFEQVAVDDLRPPALPLTAGILTTTLGNALSANPTGTIGLTAVNGTLNTYIRSDGAPALSQAIAPTWSALHTFTVAGNLTNPTVLLSSSLPVFTFDETDQASGEKRWAVFPQTKVFQMRTAADDGTGSLTFLAYTRGTGSAITDMRWGDTTNNNTYTFNSTGTATFSGQITATRFVPTSSSTPTNGLYLPAANTVGIAANSTQSTQYTSTGFAALLQLILSGDISPAQLTANTDDWAPTGLSTASVIRISTDASRNLTGITGGTDGRILILINVGVQPLVLVNDATSTAANRFLLASGTNTTVQAGGACIVWYDSTSSRWRQITRIA